MFQWRIGPIVKRKKHRLGLGTTRMDRGRSEGIITHKRLKLLVNENYHPKENSLDLEKHFTQFRTVIGTLSEYDSGWILVGYENKNTLNIQAVCYKDNVPELALHLRDNEVQYVVVRLSQEAEDVLITRNVFIIWIGPEVTPFEKGKKRTHAGKVAQLFRPFHAELSANSKQNFTKERILRLMGTNGSHIID